ncbi:ABC-2 type transport system permease protein [Anseongella ginsenosidimutans]|uniref:ABC-2 type transport system permease protein n=1 Tax=Anseongella ginsenosidimutans TaxID=496056 RepID=A0A4R3KWA4_9SPHI|nr:ABC transporter permease [Anseongella ginsenosidimutans]TCS89006.1 ABC-2 type transport system permease protein [Anseongella ginsenosidimutans]
MKQLFVFIRKEFYHVFRDRRTLLIMFGLPVVQILLFGFALTSEVKNADILVVDNAGDAQSTQLINKITASSYFTMKGKAAGYKDVEAAFKEGDIKCALIFPAGFGSDLLHQGETSIQIIADGSDPNTAKTIVNYLTAIINGYQEELSPSAAFPYRIIPETRMLYNEEGNGSLNFIPGVMALILMIVCTSLTSVSIVKEKELGTMEVLLVSPFKPILVLIAKAVPYLALSLANFALIVVLAVFVLDVELKGSLLLLTLESTLFIITCLALGLLISNVCDSQQTALLLSMMGMMLPTMIFTGFMFPLENMPWIFQVISKLIPSHWYFLIIKSVMLKGLGFAYVWKETLVLMIMTLGLLSVALKNFKIRLQ